MAIKFEPDPAKAGKRGGTGATPRKSKLPAADLRKEQRDAAKIALRRAELKKRRKRK